MSVAADPVESVRGLAGTVRDHAERIERERCLPEPVVRGLVDAGVFRMLVPRSLGGGEVDPVTACRVVEEVSILDGSVGWCAMIGACNGHFGGLLPAAGARQIYGDRDVVLAGTFRPSGVAMPVEGGYRVTGRWAFASGIMHAGWVMGGCRVQEGGRPPHVAPSGPPVTRLMFLPRAEATVLDTWHTGGLRGTGSHDFEVADVFVPAARAVSFTDPPVERGPLYGLPAVTLFAALIASVSLGIARRALELFQELASVKTPIFSPDLLRASPVARSELGQAEGLLRAGRAFLLESVRDAWATAAGGGPLSWRQRGLLWLAATQATTQALQAADIVYRAGGASSVYASTGLERCLRDIRAASQHVCVAPANYEVAGRLFLGGDMSATPWDRDNRGDAC